MTPRPAKGVRGILLNDPRTGRFTFRIYGEPDPATGRKPHTDYRIDAYDIDVEITSDYFCLIEPGPGEDGKPSISYWPRTPEQKAEAIARAMEKRERED